MDEKKKIISPYQIKDLRPQEGKPINRIGNLLDKSIEIEKAGSGVLLHLPLIIRNQEDILRFYQNSSFKITVSGVELPQLADLLLRMGTVLKNDNKHFMTKVNTKEWTQKDVEDFMSDFIGITDENSIFEKAKSVYQDMIAKGHKAWEAELIANGYREALTDIFKQK